MRAAFLLWSSEQPGAGAGTEESAFIQGGAAGKRHARLRPLRRGGRGNPESVGGVGGRKGPSSSDGADGGKPGASVSRSQAGGRQDRAYFCHRSLPDGNAPSGRDSFVSAAAGGAVRAGRGRPFPFRGRGFFQTSAKRRHRGAVPSVFGGGPAFQGRSGAGRGGAGREGSPEECRFGYFPSAEDPARGPVHVHGDSAGGAGADGDRPGIFRKGPAVPGADAVPDRTASENHAAGRGERPFRTRGLSGFGAGPGSGGGADHPGRTGGKAADRGRKCGRPGALRSCLDGGGAVQSGEKRAGSYGKRRNGARLLEPLSRTFPPVGGGRRLRDPSGGSAPYFQTLLPKQP